MTSLAQRFSQFDGLLGRIEWFISMCCMVIIVIATTLGVLFRYLLNNPLTWSNSAAIMALMWLTFISGSYLYKSGGHIGLVGLQSFAPQGLQTAIRVAFLLLIAIALGAIAIQMLTLIPLQHRKTIDSLNLPRSMYGIPLLWAALSIAFSSVSQSLGIMFAKTSPERASEQDR